MKIPIISGIIIFLFSCSPQPKKEEITDKKTNTNLQKFEWLLGTWTNITPEASLFEIWDETNDSAYTGKSYMIVNNDTTFFEKIKLEKRGGSFFYIPTVNNQNSNQPVMFKLISELNGNFIFENKEHDFPQRIIYNNGEPGILKAKIEGEDEGKFRTEEFVLKKINDNH